MAKGSSSYCLFCATPTSQSLMFGKSKGTIKEQLEVIVILRDILGLEERKLDKFSGKLNSENRIQVCGSCAEAVGRYVEAVQEIAKLQKKVASISASLKAQIYETWMEEGEGKKSIWGQLRLEVLGSGAGTDVPKAGEGEETHSILTEKSDDGQARRAQVNSTSTGSVDGPNDEVGLSTGDFNEREGQEIDEEVPPNPIFEDPLIKVEERELLLDLNESSTSTSAFPIITGIFGSVPQTKLTSVMNSSTPNQPENRKSEVESADANRKIMPVPNSTEQESYAKFQSSLRPKKYTDKEDPAEPKLKKYVCKICKRSYSHKKSFKRHLKKNICQRPNFKVPCNYCGREILNIVEHEKICRKRDDRPPVPKTPCKYCGLEFTKGKKHERICKRRPNAQSDDWWKQHLQSEASSDSDHDVTMGHDGESTDNE